MILLSDQYRFMTVDISRITDKERADSALAGDTDEARLILHLCCLQTKKGSSGVQCAVRELLYSLATNEIPIQELQKSSVVKQALRMHVPEKWLLENKAQLGSYFHAYLSNCFLKTIDEYNYPSRKRRRKKWLAIGFNLIWRKDNAAGKSRNVERDADMTQSVHLLLVDYKRGRLVGRAQRFLNKEVDTLSASVERLISLKGFILGGPFVDEFRLQVANSIVSIAERFEQPRQERDHWRYELVSQVYVECSKACRDHLVRILEESNDPAEIKRLNERIRNLASYGALPVGVGNKGTGPDGIQKVYRSNKAKYEQADLNHVMHPQIVSDELLLATPIIGDLVRLIDSIDSIDSCNSVFEELQIKRTTTPEEHEMLWPEVIDRFNCAEAAVKENSATEAT